MKERHTATRCMSFIMCVTILLLGKSSIIGEISVCIILDGIRQNNPTGLLLGGGISCLNDILTKTDMVTGGRVP